MEHHAGDPQAASERQSESRDSQSLALADLRDQIVRLQQQWRERAEKVKPEKGVSYFERDPVRYVVLRECAQGLDPLLTLVRSLLEQEKKDK
jgi:hypothetical protein